MFDKVLIANRGEIACRVAATLRRMGVASVAVYSEADRDARHVRMCDEAVCIGPAPSAESYLRVDRILDAARHTGAQAIHPGYGFLSENAGFARACAAAGLVMIGPPPEAIAIMGSKAAAKALMAEAGVPVVPGYHGEDQTGARLQREADAIGYPVLLKASAGGGGKGMRIVESAAGFAAALGACQREAAASFGDARVLLEKYLLRPRHVEIQVFGDQHGALVSLFDRDCSVQRRHQKVLEEAPAPGLSPDLRRAMADAAVAAARAVAYVGAGTVEFILADTMQFFFMEMNTRLQVEHPVTEMITGVDLVDWQVRVAAGEPLPLRQDALQVRGHAIEARIYAENPARGFLPSTGNLVHWHTPPADEFTVAAAVQDAVRIDSGVRPGDAITPFYDPMLAKLIVHGATRERALAHARAALRAFEVVGVHTNLEHLDRILASAPFAQAELDTGLIERHAEELCAPPDAPDDLAMALACAALLARQAPASEELGRFDASQASGVSAEPAFRGVSNGSEYPGMVDDAAATGARGHISPWSGLHYWRLNGPFEQEFVWQDLERDTREAVVFTHEDGALTLSRGRTRDAFEWWRGEGPHGFGVKLGASRATGRVVVHDDVFHVFHAGKACRLAWHDLLAHATDVDLGEGSLVAPMPGKLIAVLVEPGMQVERGAPLITLEAMKMEHTITAPAAGTVERILFGVGDQVAEGTQLLTLEVNT